MVREAVAAGPAGKMSRQTPWGTVNSSRRPGRSQCELPPGRVSSRNHGKRPVKGSGLCVLDKESGSFVFRYSLTAWESAEEDCHADTASCHLSPERTARLPRSDDRGRHGPAARWRSAFSPRLCPGARVRARLRVSQYVASLRGTHAMQAGIAVRDRAGVQLAFSGDPDNPGWTQQTREVTGLWPSCRAAAWSAER
jgi:hypothetical protein